MKLVLAFILTSILASTLSAVAQSAVTHNWENWTLGEQASLLDTYRTVYQYLSQAETNHIAQSTHPSDHWDNIEPMIEKIKFEITDILESCAQDFYQKNSDPLISSAIRHEEQVPHLPFTISPQGPDTLDLPQLHPTPNPLQNDDFPKSRPNIPNHLRPISKQATPQPALQPLYKQPDQQKPTFPQLFTNGDFPKEVCDLITKHNTGESFLDLLTAPNNTLNCIYLSHGIAGNLLHILIPLYILDKSDKLTGLYEISVSQADELISLESPLSTVGRATATKDSGAHFIYACLPVPSHFTKAFSIFPQSVSYFFNLSLYFCIVETKISLATQRTSPHVQEDMRKALEEKIEALADPDIS